MLNGLFCFVSQAGPHCFRIFPLLSGVIISLTVISQSPLKFPFYLQFPNGVSKLTIWLSYSSPVSLAHHYVLNMCYTRNKLGERQCLVRSSCDLIQHVWASGVFYFWKDCWRLKQDSHYNNGHLDHYKEKSNFVQKCQGKLTPRVCKPEC